MQFILLKKVMVAQNSNKTLEASCTIPSTIPYK